MQNHHRRNAVHCEGCGYACWYDEDGNFESNEEDQEMNFQQEDQEMNFQHQHRQVRVFNQAGGYHCTIDEGLTDVFPHLWNLGINTHNSCQDNFNRIWIEFELESFLTLTRLASKMIWKQEEYDALDDDASKDAYRADSDLWEKLAHGWDKEFLIDEDGEAVEEENFFYNNGDASFSVSLRLPKEEKHLLLQIIEKISASH